MRKKKYSFGAGCSSYYGKKMAGPLPKTRMLFATSLSFDLNKHAKYAGNKF
jgi:hypothetical protein